MRFNTKLYALMAVLCSGLFFTSCGDDEPNYKKTDPTPTPTDQSGKTDPTTPTISTEIKNATGFVNQVAGEIYLWSNEVSSAIKSKLNPETCTDPISAWEEVAYKNGDIQDKWSMVTNDYASFYNSTQNIEVTYGWDVTIFYVDQSHTTICFEVNYVSEGSPAANAGIKAFHCIWGAKAEEREQMLTDPEHQCITSPLQIIDILRSEVNPQSQAA